MSEPGDAETKTTRKVFYFFVAVIVAIPLILVAVLIASPSGSDIPELTKAEAQKDGWEWPLTYDSAQIFCSNAGKVLGIKVNGETYELTSGKGSSGRPGIGAIWSDAGNGAKVPLAEFAERAKESCR